MSHAQELAILMEKRVIIELEGVKLYAKKRIELEGVKLYAKKRIELEGVKLYAKKRIEKCREKIRELEAPTENGPYWVCSCGMKCYGWRGDKHVCPYCGRPNLKAISQAIYEEVDNG